MENQPAHVQITGGAGFVGANLAAHLLATTDARITNFDNLSYPGAELNLRWLRSQAWATRLRFLRGDVRSAIRVVDALRDVDEIYHLASRCEGSPQSREDFDTNMAGTLNVLEAARCSDRKPMVFYISTAKVYDAISSDALERKGQRLQPVDPRFRGISERTPASFALPNICSRGAADHCVTDYARFTTCPPWCCAPTRSRARVSLRMVDTAGLRTWSTRFLRAAQSRSTEAACRFAKRFTSQTL